LTREARPSRVHLDGYNFTPYFQGKENAGPRDAIYYFDQAGNLNALRWKDWKATFATLKGNIGAATRDVPVWAKITNLRMIPRSGPPMRVDSTRCSWSSICGCWCPRTRRGVP
jgi:hypothetical protein